MYIIQDNATHWQQEAARLASIYQNGRITIAASSSTGSADGCVMDSSRYRSREISSTDQARNIYQARARQLIEHGTWPLLSRAWVYQERLLSPRFVHFGHAVVVWECLETTECECSHSKDLTFQSLGFMRGKKSVYQIWTKAQVALPADMAHGYWAEQWRKLVSSYSRLNITFANDVFTALPGAAKQMMTSRKSRCLAGLLEGSLVDDLLWNSSKDPRPKKWRYPTWSWAMVFTDPTVATIISGTGAEYSVFEAYETIAEVHVSVKEANCMQHFCVLLGNGMRQPKRSIW